MTTLKTTRKEWTATERVCAHCGQPFLGKARAVRCADPECRKSYQKLYFRQREKNRPARRSKKDLALPRCGRDEYHFDADRLDRALFGDTIRNAVALALSTPAVAKAGRFAVVGHHKEAAPQVLRDGSPVRVFAERVLLVARRVGAKWEFRRPERAPWCDAYLERL